MGWCVCAYIHAVVYLNVYTVDLSQQTFSHTSPEITWLVISAHYILVSLYASN